MSNTWTTNTDTNTAEVCLNVLWIHCGFKCNECVMSVWGYALLVATLYINLRGKTGWYRVRRGLPQTQVISLQVGGLLCSMDLQVPLPLETQGCCLFTIWVWLRLPQTLKQEHNLWVCAASQKKNSLLSKFVAVCLCWLIYRNAGCLCSMDPTQDRLEQVLCILHKDLVRWFAPRSYSINAE